MNRLRFIIQVKIRNFLTNDFMDYLYIKFRMPREARKIINDPTVHVKIHDSAKGDYQKARKCYKKIIGLLYDGKDAGSEEKCNECIGRLVLHADRGEESMRLYDELIQSFVLIPRDTFYVPQWNAFETFFMGAGMYRLALVCREKALESIIKNKKILRGTTLFAAYLEKMDVAGMRRELKVLKRNPLNRIFIPKIVYYAECYVDLAEGKKPRPYPVLNKREKLFSNYIKGKSVLIAGPSDNGMDGSYEDAEVIIRTAEWDNQHCGEGIKGRKTNIAFLNYGMIQIMSQWSAKKKRKFLDDYDFVLMKYNDEWELEGRDNYKGTVNAEKLFLNGLLNQVPIIIQDLLVFPFRKLYVIGTNIYLNKERYSEEEEKRRLKWGGDFRRDGVANALEFSGS